MRRPRLRRDDASPLAGAMTPMIDVVFLLLVFFLCTASFDAPERNLAASLVVEPNESPGAGATRTNTPPPPDDLTLAGAAAGGATVWTANGGATARGTAELTALLRDLAAIDRGLPVTIEADATVPLGDVVLAYDAARAAGFARVVLAASADAIGAAP